MAALSFFHNPGSVAVIGASDNPDKIGGRPIRYLRTLGFAGRIYPVNPSRGVVQGLPAFPSVDALPEVPEVAVIAVPGQAAVDAVAACARLGVRGCVVMSSGFGESPDPVGHRHQERMLALAGAGGMRLLGPNTQGIASFGSGAVLGFSTMFLEQSPADGPIAIVSQSGALCSVPYGVLRRRGHGVRYAHATGNDADVSAAELAEAVLLDEEVRLLLLYLEDIRNPAEVERLAEAAARRGVPVVALSGGRSAGGQRAAVSHTGALANEVRVVDAFFERLGIWRARTTRELTAAAELYLRDPAPRGRNLAVVSNSGAFCVLAADAAADHGLDLAVLRPETRADLVAVLPRFAAASNPVDVTAALMTDSSLFGKVLPVLGGDPGVHACLIGMPVAGRGYDVGRIAADAARFATDSGVPVAVAVAQPDVGEVFRRVGLAVFEEEDSAVAALARFIRHHELRVAAGERSVLAGRRARVGRGRTLNEADSLAMVGELGIPVVPFLLSPDAHAAASAFDRLGVSSAVVKGCTSTATHKSELGLVRLGLRSRDAVAAAAGEVLESMHRHDLAVDGVLVCPMLDAPFEVLLGAHLDPVFGPVVVLGRGGTTVEVAPDLCVLLPPFTVDEARRAIAGLRMAPLLDAARGEPAADVEAWAAAASRLGEAMVQPGCTVVSLDVNPLMLFRGRGQAVLAADAVVIVEREEDR